MPIKLSAVKTTVVERIDALRRTIKDGEGMTIAEIVAHPSVAASDTQVQRTIQERRWSIRTYDAKSGRVVTVLVNPAVLAKERGGGK